MSVDLKPVTVLQLSDLHLFANPNKELLGLNTNQALEQILREVRYSPIQPHLMLLTGDLAQDESEEAYIALREKFSRFPIPIYTIPGNHDNSGLMAKVFHQPPFQSVTNFVVGGWRVILLDSSVTGQVQGHFSPEKLASLKADLTSAQEPVLLVMHHPAYDVNSQWLDRIGLDNREEFWQVIDPFEQVKVVLCGHVHQDAPFKRNQVQYLSTPSTCVQFEPHSDIFSVGSQNPGYRLLTLYPDGSFSTEVKRITLTQTVNLSAQGY